MITEDPAEIPSIRLDVYKDGSQIETIDLENRTVFKFGRSQSATSQFTDTVQLLHESISSCHAAFVIDKEQGLLLIDLGSEHGTFLNNKRLELNFPTKV